MSNSPMKIRIHGSGDMYYGEFYGSVDYPMPNVYKSREELHENWRDHKDRGENLPDHIYDLGTCYSSYGGGFYFPVSFNRRKQTIELLKLPNGESLETYDISNDELDIYTKWEYEEDYEGELSRDWGRQEFGDF